MELSTKIYLLDDNGDKFMGIGVLWLLEAIEENSSLRQAAKKMNLSYSKAYGMLTHLEETLKHPIVERHKGGQSREGVQLTSFAKDFMNLYRNFQDKAKQEVNLCYNEFVADFQKLMEVEDGKERV